MNDQGEKIDPDDSVADAGQIASLLSAALETESEQSLVHRYDWLKAMIDQVPDYIYAKDREGRFLFANQAVVHNNGFENVADLIGLTDEEIHGQAALSSRIAETERYVMQSGQPHLGFEEPAMRGGPDRWLMMSRVPLRDRNGNIIGVVGVSRDISVKKAAERLMQAQNRILEMIVGSMKIPQFLHEVVGLLEGVLDGLRCVLAVKTGEDEASTVVAASPSTLPADRTEALRSLSPARIEAALRARGREGQMAFSITVPSSDSGHYGYLGIIGHDGAPDRDNLVDFLIGAARMVGIAIDRARTEAKLRYLAEHDPLTGLANRSVLGQRLEALLRDAAGHRIAVCYLDLDRFKLVNDEFGHLAGDELLRQIAGRISASMAEGELAARIGGDEFILILREGNGDFAGRIEALAGRIGQPVRAGDMQLAVQCCIGTAVFPDDGREAGVLLGAADAALYRAKGARETAPAEA